MGNQVSGGGEKQEETVLTAATATTTSAANTATASSAPGNKNVLEASPGGGGGGGKATTLPVNVINHHAGASTTSSTSSAATATATAHSSSSSAIVVGSPMTSKDSFTETVASYFLTRLPINMNDIRSYSGSLFASSHFSQSPHHSSSLQSSSSYTPSPEERLAYNNSAKIRHGYGPSGLAPLSMLQQSGGTTNTSTKTFNSHDPVVVPVMLTWAGGGHTVYVTGTFNNWRQKICLSKSTTDFSTVIDLPPGATHRFKFIVDNEWRCSDDLPVASDTDGNLVNYLQVTDERGSDIGDGLDGLAIELEQGNLFPPSTTSTDLVGNTTSAHTTAKNSSAAVSSSIEEEFKSLSFEDEQHRQKNTVSAFVTGTVHTTSTDGPPPSRPHTLRSSSPIESYTCEIPHYLLHPYSNSSAPPPPESSTPPANNLLPLKSAMKRQQQQNPSPPPPSKGPVEDNSPMSLVLSDEPPLIFSSDDDPPSSPPAATSISNTKNNQSSSSPNSQQSSPSPPSPPPRRIPSTHLPPPPHPRPSSPPPLLPRQLEKVMLNSSSSSSSGPSPSSSSDPSLLPVPNHVTLDHLYALSIKDGVMALGSTSRYRKKYVTAIVYKPVRL